MVPMWMFPIAIACGNAFILKPSEKDPSASLLMAELLAEAGLPDGVFNVVHGDQRGGRGAARRIPDVAAVSFVGSTPIAALRLRDRRRRTASASQALGGAKNHAVVMPDADLDIAADAIASAAYGSAGQRCMAISAAVAVGDAPATRWPRRSRRASARSRSAPAPRPAREMGPLVTGGRARPRRSTAIDDAASARAPSSSVDGRELSVDGHEDGFFVGPIAVRPRHARRWRSTARRSSGRCSSCCAARRSRRRSRWSTRNPYGNGAAIFTSDGGAAREFEHASQAGMIGINVPIPVPMAYFSFGGWKHSLFGDLHVHGREGVRFYTRGKVVTERWPEQRSGAEYGFPTAHR